MIAVDASAALEHAMPLVFANGGIDCRTVARLIRGVDDTAANDRLVETLRDPHRDREWRFAIEALEELYPA